MAFAISILVFSLGLGYGHGCRLGHLMTKFTVNGPGAYRVSCSSKAFPICPEHCFWTNTTCDDYSKAHQSAQDKHFMANITYTYPLDRKGKPLQQPSDKGHKSKQKELPRTADAKDKKPVTTAVTTPAPYRKSVQRKCCISRIIHLRNCKSVEWKPSSKNGNSFDVAAYGKKELKCDRGEGVIQDIKVKNFKESSFVIEACCLNHNAGASVVACASAASAAAAAAALALARGKCKEEKFLPHESNDDAILTCAVRQRSFHVSRDRCCALCSNRFKNKWCAWAEGEAASKFFPGSGGRQTCSVCPQTAMVQSQEAIGVVQWIPAWDDVAKYQG